jgi:hypothetical protein
MIFATRRVWSGSHRCGVVPQNCAAAADSEHLEAGIKIVQGHTRRRRGWRSRLPPDGG